VFGVCDVSVVAVCLCVVVICSGCVESVCGYVCVS